MIGIIKMLLSQAGIIGMIVGGTAVFLFRPLIIGGIAKIIGKNV